MPGPPTPRSPPSEAGLRPRPVPRRTVPLLPSVTARGASPEPPLALWPILAALIYVAL